MMPSTCPRYLARATQRRSDERRVAPLRIVVAQAFVVRSATTGVVVHTSHAAQGIAQGPPYVRRARVCVCGCCVMCGWNRTVRTDQGPRSPWCTPAVKSLPQGGGQWTPPRQHAASQGSGRVGSQSPKTLTRGSTLDRQGTTPTCHTSVAPSGRNALQQLQDRSDRSFRSNVRPRLYARIYK